MQKNDSFLSESQCFCRPAVGLRMEFMNSHPIQPVRTDLPFFAAEVYQRSIKAATHSEVLQRSWISYSIQKKAFFCSVCLGFGETGSLSAFVSTDGFHDWKHKYQAIK